MVNLCINYEEKEKVDLTELKTYLFSENIHNLNPTLFKRINDMAKKSNFSGELTALEFERLFMA